MKQASTGKRLNLTAKGSGHWLAMTYGTSLGSCYKPPGYACHRTSPQTTTFRNLAHKSHHPGSAKVLVKVLAKVLARDLAKVQVSVLVQALCLA